MGSTLIPIDPNREAVLRKQRNFEAASSHACAMEDRTIRVEAGVYRFPIGRGLSIRDRETIDVLVDELSRRLSEVIPDDAVAFIERIAEQVHASFKMRGSQTTDLSILDGFLIALPGRSAPAVREAVRRLIRNEAPSEFSTTFTPTPGDLAKLSMRIEVEWRLERDRLVRLRSIPEERPPPAGLRPSVEEMAATRERIRRMTGRAAELRRMPIDRGSRGVSPAARVAEELAARRRGARDGEPSQ